MSHNRYFPDILDPYINQILTEGQRKVWQDLPKMHFESIQFPNMINQGMVIGPWEEAEDADLMAALAEEPKK